VQSTTLPNPLMLPTSWHEPPAQFNEARMITRRLSAQHGHGVETSRPLR